ncbi:MAG: hypothetical protein QF893_16060 [Alphaproteobacteria bacterium]|jgi:hypothetical protein|nr:hypothetical protein [Alphaproteobacteria bacterium]
MHCRIAILAASAAFLAGCVADGGGTPRAVGDQGLTTTPYESHYTYECQFRGIEPGTEAFRACVETVRLERMGRFP